MLNRDFLGEKILEGCTLLHRFDSGSTPATPLRDFARWYADCYDVGASVTMLKLSAGHRFFPP